jgi:hypothetical protein
MFNTPSILTRGHNIQIATKFAEQWQRQRFGHDICDLILGGDWSYFKLTPRNLFPYKVIVNFNMLHTSMEYWISE